MDLSIYKGIQNVSINCLRVWRSSVHRLLKPFGESSKILIFIQLSSHEIILRLVMKCEKGHCFFFISNSSSCKSYFMLPHLIDVFDTFIQIFTSSRDSGRLHDEASSKIPLKSEPYEREEQKQSTEAHSMEISMSKIWIKFTFSLCDFVHSTWTTSVRAHTASWRCRMAAADVTYLSSRLIFK